MEPPKLTEKEKQKLIADVMEGKMEAAELAKYGINIEDEWYDDDEADDLLKTNMDEIGDDD